jgi:Ca2+-binding RTX toxin-like protein
LEALGLPSAPSSHDPRGMILQGTSRSEELTGGSGNDMIFGAGGNDELKGEAGNDRIDGGDGRDELDGGTGDDRLFGGNDRDELDGGRGDDHLFGGNDGDDLDGGRGDDVLVGGLGKDELEGGTGSDWFVFTNANEGVDSIDDFRTRGSDQDSIVFLKSMFGGFSGDDGADLVAGGFLRARATSGGNTDIQIDVDGGGNNFVTIATIDDRITTNVLAQHTLVVDSIL